MKKIIFLVLFIFTLMNCKSKNDAFYFEKVLEEGQQDSEIEEVQEQTMTINKINENIISFHNELYNIHYVVVFSIFSNCNFTNGYVILKQIIETDHNNSEYIIEPVYADYPSNYIATIHNHNEFLIRTPEGEKNLTDIVARDIFRTGEAMIMCYLNNQDTNINIIDLKNATNRMFNRQYGVPLN